MSGVDVAAFGQDLLSNFFSNLLCVLLPLGLAIVLYRFRGRRRIRGFFGLAKRRGATVHVRLSNIQVKADGTISSVKIEKTTIQDALLRGEYERAQRMAERIQNQSFVGALFTLLERLNVQPFDPPVVCRITTSPSRDSAADEGPLDLANDPAQTERLNEVLTEEECFVLVGSPVYNMLTYYVLNHPGADPVARFEPSTDEPQHYASAVSVRYMSNTVRMPGVFARRKVDDGRGSHSFEEYFLLQKLTDFPRKGTTVFICAGTSQVATAAALDALSDWHSLFAQFGMRPFAMLGRVNAEDRERVPAWVRDAPSLEYKQVWAHQAPR